MNLKKLLGNIGCSALSTVAPPIGGMAANVIKKALGLDEKATEKEVVAAIEKATPEQVLALKKADNDFMVKMKELDIDVIELDKEDTKNARSFASKVGLSTVNALAFLNAISSIVAMVGVGYLVFHNSLDKIDALTASLLTLVVREIFAKQEQIYNFFFGSSHGSKEKTQLMDNHK